MSARDEECDTCLDCQLGNHEWCVVWPLDADDDSVNCDCGVCHD